MCSPSESERLKKPSPTLQRSTVLSSWPQVAGDIKTGNACSCWAPFCCRCWNHILHSFHDHSGKTAHQQTMYPILCKSKKLGYFNHIHLWSSMHTRSQAWAEGGVRWKSRANHLSDCNFPIATSKQHRLQPPQQPEARPVCLPLQLHLWCCMLPQL